MIVWAEVDAAGLPAVTGKCTNPEDVPEGAVIVPPGIDPATCILRGGEWLPQPQEETP